jgi:hypothetical protein
MAVSDPALRELVATRHHPIVIELPQNVVIRGADNIVFENNIRIHSEENMAITTRQILTINDPDMKQDSFVSRDRLDGSFDARLKALEAGMKKVEQSKLQELAKLFPPCEHKKENKHASSGKTRRQVKGASKARSNDSGGRKSGYPRQRKTTTQTG